MIGTGNDSYRRIIRARIRFTNDKIEGNEDKNTG
jgi:hypothetical protein